MSFYTFVNAMPRDEQEWYIHLFGAECFALMLIDMWLNYRKLEQNN